MLAMMVAAVKIINGNNTLEWEHLVSIKSSDGRQIADWDKIGKGCAVILCVLSTIVYTYSPMMEATGLAAILAVVLAYLGGVSAYASTLKARAGAVTTTSVVEPIPDPSSVKKTETIVETPPVQPKKGKK